MKVLRVLGAALVFLSSIVALPEFGLNISDRFSSKSSISITVIDSLLHNNDSLNINVFYHDQNQQINSFSILPIIENTSNVMVKDFCLTYNVTMRGKAPIPNELYKLISIDEKNYQYRYTENSLAQFSKAFEPFRLSSLLSEEYSPIDIITEVSYEGADELFRSFIHISSIEVNKGSDEKISDWITKCKYSQKELSETNTYDLYCYENDIKVEKPFTHSLEEKVFANVETNKSFVNEERPWWLVILNYLYILFLSCIWYWFVKWVYRCSKHYSDYDKRYYRYFYIFLTCVFAIMGVCLNGLIWYKTISNQIDPFGNILKSIGIDI